MKQMIFSFCASQYSVAVTMYVKPASEQMMSTLSVTSCSRIALCINRLDVIEFSPSIFWTKWPSYFHKCCRYCSKCFLWFFFFKFTKNKNKTSISKSRSTALLHLFSAIRKFSGSSFPLVTDVEVDADGDTRIIMKFYNFDFNHLWK